LKKATIMKWSLPVGFREHLAAERRILNNGSTLGPDSSRKRLDIC
jgi:hypothetical protein